jgi:hypothetical protein
MLLDIARCADISTGSCGPLSVWVIRKAIHIWKDVMRLVTYMIVKIVGLSGGALAQDNVDQSS